MRNLAIILLLSISLAAGIHLLSRSDYLSSFSREVPQDAFALLILNQIPRSFDFISKIEWGEIVEIDQADLKQSLEDTFNEGFLPTIEEGVEGLAISVFDLKRKQNGEFRIDFVAQVIPKAGARTRLLALLEELILQRFGEGASTVSEGNQTVYAGTEPGEYLMVETTDSTLTISNSREAWEALIETRSGKAQSLFSRLSFRKVLEEIDSRSDLFLYIQGDGTWIPEFGYSIEGINSKNPLTHYSSVPREPTKRK